MTDISPEAVERHTELMLKYNLIDAVKCMDALSARNAALEAEVARLRDGAAGPNADLQKLLVEHRAMLVRRVDEAVRVGGPLLTQRMRVDLERLEKIDAALRALATRIAELEAEVARLREALGNIAAQKRTDELVTVVDVEYADFEGAYDICIDVARAALQDKPHD